MLHVLAGASGATTTREEGNWAQRLTGAVKGKLQISERLASTKDTQFAHHTHWGGGGPMEALDCMVAGNHHPVAMVGWVSTQPLQCTRWYSLLCKLAGRDAHLVLCSPIRPEGLALSYWSCNPRQGPGNDATV